MVYTGDEGIKRKFFCDLKRFFPRKPEVDIQLRDFQTVGLKSNPSGNFTEDSKELSSNRDENIGKHSTRYPIRPDAEDCLFFIRTGICKFGRTCKFNHPVLTKNLVDQNKSNENGDGSSSKIPSEIPCKFYPAGLCKYGESCRFNHTKSETEKSSLQLNTFGYPKRLGKLDCSFYLRTGMCGYGASCRFNHPDPITALDPESNNSKEVLDLNQPYISRPLRTTSNFPFVHQTCVLCRYQSLKFKQIVEIDEDYSSESDPCELNDVGLPIRPGKKVCWIYENLGICSFGCACVYDHPEKHTYGSTSASPSGVRTQENGTPQE